MGSLGPCALLTVLSSVPPGHAEARDHDPAGHGAVICGVAAHPDAGEAHSLPPSPRGAILSLRGCQTCRNKPISWTGSRGQRGEKNDPGTHHPSIENPPCNCPEEEASPRAGEDTKGP